MHTFDTALQNGVLENVSATGATTTTAAPATAPVTPAPVTTTAGAPGFNSGGVNGAITQLGAAKKGGKDELVIYQNVAMAAGKQSGNPWLLELPDPITRATWDNYAMISLAKANQLGVKLDMNYEYYREKPVIKLSVGNKEVSLPVLVMPGMDANTIAVPIG